MWRCGNCNKEIEDKYNICWNCGLRHSLSISTSKPLTPEEIAKRKEHSIPKFASLDELAPPSQKSKSPTKDFTIGYIAYILGGTVGVVILKAITNVLFGAYSLYIWLPIILVGAIAIFWKLFHRDPDEGIGIDLH